MTHLASPTDDSDVEVTTPAEPDPTDWVDAAPFRSHLTHLMAAGSMSAEAVAAMADIPARAVRHLLHGRRGRVQRRVCPLVARRLLQLTTADARWARIRLVRAEPVTEQLRELLEAGVELAELARSTGLPTEELARLRDGVDHCTQLVAVQVLVEYAARLGREELIYRGPADGRAAA